MDNKMLISTAMLNAYWENEKKDTFELLVPFVKFSIAKTTKQGEEINFSSLLEHFRKEFGYETIPSNVITLILNRMSPKVLEKNRGKYILKSSLDEDVINFEKRHTKFSERRSIVAKALKDFLNENLTLRNLYDEEDALQALISFFATNGMCTIRDTILLEMLKKNNDALKYSVAQFIIKEWEAKSAIFNYIEDMIKGFFVSSAISLQSQNTAVANSRFKDLQCYIDTRVIINALGLHIPEARVASLELLNMLKDKGAELCCFEHNCREINDIITAYKNGITNPLYNRSNQTLEEWDKKKYTVTDIERYQKLLANKISTLGIKIIARPSISDVNKYPFNDADLVSHINEHMNYNKRSAIETDVSSVASILLLRDGKKTSEIEKSKAIFVTSNLTLVNVVNMFLKDNEICCLENEVMPVITDMDMSSIVWLKCYSTHKNYPKQRLIEHALIALEPSPMMLSTFFDIVDRIESEGGISEDEAAIIRTDIFCKKELSKAVKGNSNIITEQTVYDIREKLREKYLGDIKAEGELNYKKYLKEREEKRASIVKALENIKLIKRTSFEKLYKILCRISMLIELALIVIFIILSAINIKDAEKLALSIFLLIFGVFGIIDMVFTKQKLVRGFIRHIANVYSDRCADKKKVEYEAILGTISYDFSSEI